MDIKSIPFTDPLKFAEKISVHCGEKNWVFLYSGLNKDVKNSSSVIALFPQEEIITDNFAQAEKIIAAGDKKWFGYLSYEVGGEFERTHTTKNSFINLPKIHLINFAVIFEFDHSRKSLNVVFEDEKLLEKALNWAFDEDEILPSIHDGVCKLDSNFSNNSYLAEVRDIQKMIAAGDFYQTNLTRKFFGEFNEVMKSQDSFQMFKKLTKSSPANYMSFLKLGNAAIISSSPELFLEIKNNKILSRPIKGTTPRSLNKSEDRENKLFLKNSLKERAENLMIVDLVRNDLARVCKAGSVKVKNLFKITSYKTLHHMSSEITGKIADDFGVFDCIKNCFPAGSMTGAPKIKAMAVAAKKEGLNRGVYSGTIGFIEGNKSANLSVVIRTLIIEEKKFEFQVGGAITYDSKPESELLETFNKAKAILGILESAPH